MRTYPDCLPCILRASLNAARFGGAQDEAIWPVLQEAAAICSRWERKKPPIALGGEVVALLRQRLGQSDPFLEKKREGNARILRLYPELQARVSQAPDPLAEALHLAAAANALDLGIHTDFAFEETMFSALDKSLGRWDYPFFQACLAQSREILYLADNAGEIVVDRILIEELLRLGKRVTLAVRAEPVLNDATLSDLEEVRLPKEVKVITTGSALPGVFLSATSPEFRERLRAADLVIAKGMGNFEGLSEESEPIFFLLMAKCVPVAAELGVELGKLVLKANISEMKLPGP